MLVLVSLIALLNAPRLASGNLLFSFGGFNGWPTALYLRLMEGDVLYRDVIWPLPPLVTWLYGAAASFLGPGPRAEGAASIACQIAIALATFVVLRGIGIGRTMGIAVAGTQATMSALAHETLLYNSVSLAFGWLAVVLIFGQKQRAPGLVGAGIAAAACGFAKQSIGVPVVLAIIASLAVEGAPTSGERGRRILIFSASAAGAALLFVIGISATASLDGFWRAVVAGGTGAKGGLWTVIGNATDFFRLAHPRFQLPSLLAGLLLGSMLSHRPHTAPATLDVRNDASAAEKWVSIVALAVLTVCGLLLSLHLANPWLAGARLLQFGILVAMPAVVGYALGAGAMCLLAGYPGLSILLFGSLGLAIGRSLSGHMTLNYEAAAIGFVPLSFILASTLTGIARILIRSGLLLAFTVGAVVIASQNSLHLDHAMRMPVWEGEIIESPAGRWRIPTLTARAVSDLRALVSKASGNAAQKNPSCHVFGDPLVATWLGCRERSVGLVWYTDMLPDSLLAREQSLLDKHPPRVMLLPASPPATDAVKKKLQLIRKGSAAEMLYDRIVHDIATGRYHVAGSVDITGMNGYGAGPVEMLVLRRAEPRAP